MSRRCASECCCVRKIRVTATLILDAHDYPQHDEQAEHWLLRDILLDNCHGGLRVISDEIGDEVGRLEIDTVEVPR